MGCCASKEAVQVGEEPNGPLFAWPKLASVMKGKLRSDMNKSMQVTKHENDCSYKEVQDFMVPSSVGNKFTDAPGTFDPNMKGRIRDTNGPVVMHRLGMVAAGAPHSDGITFAKFEEHRGYAVPGYEEKAPQIGDVAPDGKILSLDADGPESTLLTEAKKLAEAAGSKRVILAFTAVTCPFYRAYAAQDLYKMYNGVPVLHIYQREAEPADVFDAGGMHCTSPLKMRRRVLWHKTEADRRLVAKETKKFLETFMGKGNCTMWMDTMDDELEATYESRPWRQYVIEVESGKIIERLGLAPFNMKGKVAAMKAACADGP